MAQNENMDELCYENSCKHKGKAGKGPADKIRCCSCMRWHHEDCVKQMEKEKSITGIWNCDKCRVVPSQVCEVLKIVKELQNGIIELTSANTKLQSDMTVVTNDCKYLKGENTKLQTQLQALKDDIKNIQQCNDSEHSSDSTLLAGDSLLRSIDEKKLLNTKVVSISGGNIKDVKEAVSKVDGPFDRVLCLAGTNDCSSDAFDANCLSQQYKELVDVAKEKVRDPKNVSLISLPPCSDKHNFHGRMDSANAVMTATAQEESIGFINNDVHFKLSDGTVNDGYLAPDGLHLNWGGTTRLVNNMKLKLKGTAKGDCTTNKRKSTKQNSRTPAQNQGNKSRTTNGRQYSEVVRSNGNKNTNNANNARKNHYCWYCGEENHSSANCRHGEEITCYTCNEKGHKAKYCYNYH